MGAILDDELGNKLQQTRRQQMVKHLQTASLICWAISGWAIAAELDLLPRLGELAWSRWQVSLLAGLAFWSTGDRLADCRCRCCGASEVRLRGLLTRSHELLCHRCLRWNPSLGSQAPSPSQASLSSES